MKLNPLFIKAATLFFIFIVLMIIVFQMRHTVDERKWLSQGVKNEISNSYSKSQILTGPFILVNYLHRYQTTEYDKDNNEIKKWKEEEKYRFIRPHDYLVDTELNVEMRQRGIYQAPVYQTHNAISGSFQIPKNFGITGENDVLSKAHLIMSFSDMRGLIDIPEINIHEHSGYQNIDAANHHQEGKIIAQIENNSPTYTVALNNPSHQSNDAGIPDSNKHQTNDDPILEMVRLTAALDSTDDSSFNLKNSLSVAVTHLNVDEDKHYSFNTEINLKGSNHFSVLPIGNNTTVNINSNWLHPSYYGLFLPSSKDQIDDGFSASWKTNHIAAQSAISCLTTDFSCNDNQAISVRLMDSIDHYVKNDRSTKYAYLFILLTFAAFFLIEVLKKMKIHGIQYGLVGMSLTLFYLLLLALSEHIGFDLSYFIAAAACIALISGYLSTVLKSTKLAALFGAGLGLVYGVLYLILLSEDYALLMGAFLVFTAVAIIMFATRKVDWYQFSRTNKHE